MLLRVQPASKRAKVDKPSRQAKKSMLVQASMPALFQRDSTKHQVSTIATHTLPFIFDSSFNNPSVTFAARDQGLMPSGFRRKIRPHTLHVGGLL